MKPGTFTQIYVQLVFSPKGRECLIRREIKAVLYKYINSTIQKLGHKVLNINGMPDHIHILIGLNPKQSISDLVRDVKRSSSLFINEKKWFPGKFQWQEGYGGFSYGKSQLKDVHDYINNQEFHHKKRSFREEYISFLEKFEIEYDKRFLFDFFD